MNIVQAPPLSFALTAKGGRFDGESETFIAHSLRGEGFDAIGPLTTRSTPNGHGMAGVNDQEVFGGQIVPVAFARVRRLLPIECEKCQGMPRDWTRYGIDDKGNEVELSDSARYRLIGNSVAVPVVEWIGKRIMESNQQLGES